MQQWTCEERAFAVKAYYQNGGGLVWARPAFHTHFNVRRNRPVQSNHAIHTRVDNCEVSGSTSNKRGGTRKTVQTPDNIERVREAFERNPRRSTVQHATTLRITPRSVRRILHDDLHYHPHEMCTDANWLEHILQKSAALHFSRFFVPYYYIYVL